MKRAYLEQVAATRSIALMGRVEHSQGNTISVANMRAPIGARVEIQRDGEPLVGEVVGFRNDSSLVLPYKSLDGVHQGTQVTLTRTLQDVKLGTGLLGRVVDAQGIPIDGQGPLATVERAPVDCEPPISVERPRIDQPLATGVRSIDSMLTCGQGQRMGIFAGSGVGKSVLMGMMARYTSADVNVIALIGERGREVNEFLERDLGPQGRQRSAVVVASSNEPAVLRVRAAMTATAIAEYFRDQGKNVLLIMDSLTRFAMAQREIGLAAGEPPTTRGYPPSVFSMLPRLVERAGRNRLGSITAFYSVLVEGDDFNEPISDAVRGLLDGHTMLSRKLASEGHYPAIDVLESISRLANEINPPQIKEAISVVRQLLAAYRENEDLINIGAYRAGANPLVDTAVALREPLNFFLRQAVEEPSTLDSTQKQLLAIATQAQALIAQMGAKTNEAPAQQG